MSSILPVFPLIPQKSPLGWACLALNSVKTLTTSAPQFYAKVLGITSKEYASALNGNYYKPSTVLAFSFNLLESSISTAPPPGNNLGSYKMFLHTAKASCKFLSISFKTSLLAPLNKIVQAFGFWHSTINMKYSSPILLISKSPHSVPISLSCNSSGLLTIVAPDTLAILWLSVFLTLLITLIFYFNKKCWAISETPFSVMTTSGLNFMMAEHN